MCAAVVVVVAVMILMVVSALAAPLVKFVKIVQARKHNSFFGRLVLFHTRAAQLLVRIRQSDQRESQSHSSDNCQPSLSPVTVH